jgi:hypothetical protein
MAAMRDLAVQLAGMLAVGAGVVHGVLGETKVFARARIEPERARLLIRLVWHVGVISWISLAVLLIVAPKLGSDAARNWIIAVSIVTFGFAAFANAWATRGRHFGWVVLSIVVGLAAIGL